MEHKMKLSEDCYGLQYVMQWESSGGRIERLCIASVNDKASCVTFAVHAPGKRNHRYFVVRNVQDGCETFLNIYAKRIPASMSIVINVVALLTFDISLRDLQKLCSVTITGDMESDYRN